MEYTLFNYYIRIDATGQEMYLILRLFNDIPWKKLQENLNDHISNSGKSVSEFFFEDETVGLLNCLLDEKNRSIIEYILKFGKYQDNLFSFHGEYARGLLELLIGYEKVFELDSEQPLFIIDKMQNMRFCLDINEHMVHVYPDKEKKPGLFTCSGEKWYRYGNQLGRLVTVYQQPQWDELLSTGKVYKNDELYDFIDNLFNYWDRYLDFDWQNKKNKLRVLNNNLTIELFVDYNEEMVQVKPTYFYGDLQFTYDDITKKGRYIIKLINNDFYFIKRDPKKERMLFLFFFQYNFTWEGEFFVLKKNDDIIEFLITGYKKIPPEWTKKLTANFRKIRIHNIKVKPVLNIALSADSDKFEVKLNCHTHEDITIDLEKLKTSILNEEEYIRLNPTEILKIINLQEIKEILEKVNQVFQVQFKKETVYSNSMYFLPHFIHYMHQFDDVEISGNQPFMELYDEMINIRGIKKIPLPPEVENVLREYQKDGYNWLHFLHRYKMSGVLADDMGLGKTVQALALLRSIDVNTPSIVVCPKSLMHNWHKEIRKFIPGMPVLVVEGNRITREELIAKYGKYKLFITSYSLLRNDIDLYEKLGFYYAVLDEAQHIKNYQTKVAKSVKALNAQFRLVLTGTPMENSIRELWSIFDFIMPGYLGSRKHFIEFYDKEIEREKRSEAMKELNLKIKPFMLRRTKAEVLTELPPKIEQVSSVPLSEEQSTLYNNILRQLRAEIFGLVEKNGYVKSRMHILSALVKLRQICNHPGMIYPELAVNEEVSAKMDLLREILYESIDGGHRILLFSQFVKMLHIIRDFLRKEEIEFEYLDGKTTDRLEVVDRFNANPAVPIILVSLKAGGTGLNITGADIVVHFDPWWNPMVERQATDRAYRMGQTRSVNVYKFITEGTIEEKILKMQEDKSDIFNALDFSDTFFMQNMSWDDLKVLFD